MSTGPCNAYVGDTDASEVRVDVEAGDDDGVLRVYVTTLPHGGGTADLQGVELTMDEARQVLAGLAAVIR